MSLSALFALFSKRDWIYSAIEIKWIYYIFIIVSAHRVCELAASNAQWTCTNVFHSFQMPIVQMRKFEIITKYVLEATAAEVVTKNILRQMNYVVFFFLFLWGKLESRLTEPALTDKNRNKIYTRRWPKHITSSLSHAVVGAIYLAESASLFSVSLKSCDMRVSGVWVCECVWSLLRHTQKMGIRFQPYILHKYLLAFLCRYFAISLHFANCKVWAQTQLNYTPTIHSIIRN